MTTDAPSPRSGAKVSSPRSGAEGPLPRSAHPVLGVLRAGILLGLGWVAAAGLAWEAFGVPWAALVLVVWVLLLRRFHGAVQAMAVVIRDEVAARHERPR